MEKDTLILCPKCQGDACYKSPLNETLFSYYCFSCGYSTTDAQTVDEFEIEAYEETLPELYKDIKHIDEEGRIWYPNTINLPEKGTVFLGINLKTGLVEWCGIQVRKLTTEEKKQLANKGIKFKSDASTMKFFGKDFIEALGYIGFFDVQEPKKK